MADDGRKELELALTVAEGDSPDTVCRAIRWLSDPKARRVRIPLGVLFILGSFLWFLPVLGIELLPIGLLLIAQDIPFLRKPVARAMLWLERRWERFRSRHRPRGAPGGQGECSAAARQAVAASVAPSELPAGETPPGRTKPSSVRRRDRTPPA